MLKRKSQTELSNTYQYFLRESLTGELVYIILTSICKESERSFSDHNLKFGANFSFPNEIKYFSDWAFKETKETHIDFVEIQENILEKSDSWSKNKVKTIWINSETKIIEFAPWVFEFIWSLDGITNQSIQESLDPVKNKKRIQSAGEGSGKSGSFFFFSHDSQFIIKTMNESEKRRFKKIFKDYTEIV